MTSNDLREAIAKRKALYIEKKRVLSLSYKADMRALKEALRATERAEKAINDL